MVFLQKVETFFHIIFSGTARAVMRFYSNIGLKYQFTAYIGALIITVYIYKYFKGRKLDVTKRQLIGIYLFFLYILLTFFSTTFARSIRPDYTFHLQLLSQHIRAFGGNLYLAKQIFYNILMMVPFGILLPVAMRQELGIWKCLYWALLYSLLIEIIQLIFKFGAYETDDVLNNCIGALIGFEINLLCKRIHRWHQKLQYNQRDKLS